MEVKRKAIGLMLDGIIDYRGKTPPKSEAGIPCISAANVKNGRLVMSNPSYVSRETYESWTTRGFPRPGDVIITTEAPAGEVAAFPGDQTYLLTRRVMALQPNPAELDEKFLLYALQTNFIKEELYAVARGTTVPRVLKTDITDLEIPLPPLPEQKAIAHILGTLDDKIELNRRMNATLEGMAQALFKSWFVDFDPVIDNALAAGNPIPDELAPRAEVRKTALDNGTIQQGLADHPTLSDPKSFSSAFEYSDELGWIPEGWEAKSLGDLIDIKGGTQPPASQFKEEPSEGYVRLVQIRDYDTSNHLTYIPDSTKLRKTAPMEIMIGRYGAAVGRILWGLEGAYNVALVRVDLVDDGLRELIRSYLLTDRFQNQMQAISGRSAQSGFNKGDIRSFYVCLPKPDQLKAYEEFCNPIRRNGLHLNRKNATLNKLRDTLLLKLISGELRLTETEQLTKEALA